MPKNKSSRAAVVRLRLNGLSTFGSRLTSLDADSHGVRASRELWGTRHGFVKTRVSLRADFTHKIRMVLSLQERWSI